MRLGAHVSIAGGVDKAIDRAKELGIDTFQIFAKNPRGWTGKELTKSQIDKFKDKLEATEISPVIIHINYLTNLATPKDELYQKSKLALKDDIQRADSLGADYLILHPGNHTGSGLKAGIERVNTALKEVISEIQPGVKLLLENVAGSGTEIGVNFKNLLKMTSGISLKRIGLCLDTCHAFGAGYDLTNRGAVNKLLDEIEATFGLDNLEVIHVNDSKQELGSNKDRHYHIGQGKIGLTGFELLVNHSCLQKKAFIIETPVDESGDDELNLKTLKDLVE